MVERKIRKNNEKMEIENRYDFITIIGPTASGKTSRAVSLAKLLKGEILSADSRQVYEGMDIGTGKDLEEYEDVPYHLIDVASAGEKYNLHRYLKDFEKAYQEILNNGRYPVLCGGSGLYVESVLSGIKLPEVPVNAELRESLKNRSLKELEEILRSKKKLHNKTDIDTAQRAIRAIEIEEFYEKNPDLANYSSKTFSKPRNSLLIGIDISREKRRERITRRLEERIKNGMIDEVRNLMASGVSAEDLIYYGLEYKFITLYLLDKLSLSEMKKGLEIAIHQFAKRQMTWFRGMERRGYKIHWIPFELNHEEFNRRILSLI